MARKRLLLDLILACALLLFVTQYWPRIRPAPWLKGMDADGNGYLSRAEWLAFHQRPRRCPLVYGGRDERGDIPLDDYGREFDRVDCNRNSEMDTCEYKQLRFNQRWCESEYKPRGVRAFVHCMLE